jgi:hypothetical protein
VRKLAAAALLAAAAFGATFETWEAFDARLVSVGATSVVFHTQFRQRQRLRDFFYARFGPVVRSRLNPRLSLVGGFYYGEAEEERASWGDNHRLFTGVETPFLTSVGLISVRHMVEDHFGGPTSAEIRNRTQFQLSRPVREWTAFGGTEVFFDQRGFMQQRFQSGLRIPLTTGYRMDLIYLFDARVQRAGESRHVIQAAFRPRSKER